MTQRIGPVRICSIENKFLNSTEERIDFLAIDLQDQFCIFGIYRIEHAFDRI